MDPVLQVGQRGAGLGGIIGELVILMAIVAATLVALRALIGRQRRGLGLLH